MPHSSVDDATHEDERGPGGPDDARAPDDPSRDAGAPPAGALDPDDRGRRDPGGEGDGDRDEDGDALGAADIDEPARHPRPWGRIASIVSLVYVAWYVIGLVVLQRAPGAFNAMNRFYGSIGARVVLCGVLLALLFHLLDGLRVTAQDALPRLAAHELGLRATVRFVLLAAWIPAAAAVLWPAIRTWFSR